MKDGCETQESCCSEKSGSCGTESCGCGSGQSCGCGESGCPDPVDKSIHSWISAFFEAKREVEVDLLKEKIRKAWGSRMEKAADAVFETVEAIWKSTVSKAEAKNKLRERFAAIFRETQK